jgi:hypothetical protein
MVPLFHVCGCASFTVPLVVVDCAKANAGRRKSAARESSMRFKGYSAARRWRKSTTTDSTPYHYHLSMRISGENALGVPEFVGVHEVPINAVDGAVALNHANHFFP